MSQVDEDLLVKLSKIEKKLDAILNRVDVVLNILCETNDFSNDDESKEYEPVFYVEDLDGTTFKRERKRKISSTFSGNAPPHKKLKIAQCLVLFIYLYVHYLLHNLLQHC